MINDLRWRYWTVVIGLTIFGFLIVGQSARLQFGPQAKEIIAQSERYKYDTILIVPPRGQIYDRGGHLLAGNITTYEVGVNLVDVSSDPVDLAIALKGVLGLDYSVAYDLVNTTYDPNEAVYITIQRGVSAEDVETLQVIHQNWKDDTTGDAPNVSGLMYTPELQRSYPEGDLAANILGFVGQTDEGRPIGLFGIEQYYNDQLSGVSEEVDVPIDPNLVELLPEVEPGASLILTIDREIQSMAEDQLDLALETYEAKAGTIVIMNPNTGELLAMATSPRINPGKYWEYDNFFPDPAEEQDEVLTYNPAVSSIYEPGSVFKVITMAAALDAGVVEPDTTYIDRGIYEMGGITIRNWQNIIGGEQTMQGCMQLSLNVCLAWVGEELGAGTFYEYLQEFGFGHFTTIDLAYEARGRLKLPGDGDWYPADLGANTFGQGIAVTPMQMMMAVSAIANQGQMVWPHIVKAQINSGVQYDIRPQIAGQPISAETAITLTEMLAQSIENEASLARVDGYRLAGKTGTAEIPTDDGYSSETTNASFVGWGPVDDPQFLVYVWLEEPGASIWGSQTAAPVFGNIVADLVVLMDIPPDYVRVGMAGP